VTATPPGAANLFRPVKGLPTPKKPVCVCGACEQARKTTITSLGTVNLGTSVTGHDKLIKKLQRRSSRGRAARRGKRGRRG
jgi:hypothetical protein